MSRRKYERGRQICSVSDFERSGSDWFIVMFGADQRTRHRAFLISLQYRTLENFIKRGAVFEARAREASIIHDERGARYIDTERRS